MRKEANMKLRKDHKIHTGNIIKLKTTKWSNFNGIKDFSIAKCSLVRTTTKN